ncbi:hypothetical protein [Rathayibacter rathayi]|uniref:hypothetical protein n=1 Tax=Rathayibacter rathayi TaxID=33887 RepID=UPI0015E3F028|nr:hypothetical protein [Rathayibacter rathayi]
MPSVDAGGQPDWGLEEKVFDFVLEIMEMLAKIIPNGLVGLETGTNARNRENGSDRVAPDRRTDEQRH